MFLCGNLFIFYLDFYDEPFRVLVDNSCRGAVAVFCVLTCVFSFSITIDFSMLNVLV